MLSNEQERILKYLYPSNTIDIASLTSRFSVDDFVINDLYHQNLIRNASSNFHIHTVCLTEAGKAYVEQKRNEQIRYFIPVIISVLALIISVIALSKQ